MLTKSQLREEMARKRQALPASTLRIHGEALALHYSDHPILRDYASVGGYTAVRGEIDVLPVLARAASLGKATALPRLTDEGSLQFYAWAPGDALEADRYGIPCPSISAPVIVPALLIVPMVAFDGTGHRLGYGAGYYDRYLASIRTAGEPPMVIGAAHALQEVPTLPAEPHDQPIEGVITELGISMFARHSTAAGGWR